MNTSTLSSTSIAESIREKGYYIKENLLDSHECDEARNYLDDYWKSLGSPSKKEDHFSFAIHPLIPKVPALAHYLLEHPTLLEILHEAFSEPSEVRLGGARMDNENSDAQIIGWHHHYGWDTADLPNRKGIGRVLANIYLDGSNDEIGALSVIPRRFDEPIGERPTDNDPRETSVHLSPGSVIVFDTAVWHRAKRGSKPGMRHVFGGHFQAKSNLRPHREDNDVTVPEWFERLRKG